jgi:hypothetical protein
LPLPPLWLTTAITLLIGRVLFAGSVQKGEIPAQPLKYRTLRENRQGGITK